MVEDKNQNGTLESGNDTVNNSPSPEGNPFKNGNKEENPSNSEKTGTESQQGENPEFLLFLILILLLMGNTKSFNNHFQLIDDEVKKINKLLEAVSVTNENLQNAVKAPQEVMQNFKDFNN